MSSHRGVGRARYDGVMLDEIRTRIAAACRRVGRSASEVTLLAVTKGQSAERIRSQLFEQGVRTFGENRVQEWRDKSPLLPGASWHLVGNLQRNKVKYCRDFTLIHSLNSVRLAAALDDFGRRHDHDFRVLIEVNVAGEASKQGVALGEVEALLAHASSLSHLRIEGLMTMAPYSDDPEAARPVFAELRGLRDSLGLAELSMGMSGDFEVAIEEGATIVRIGSALFPRRKEAPPA